jgi:cytochrome c556
MGITPEGHGQGILDKQQLQQLPQQMKNIMALTQQWHGGGKQHMNNNINNCNSCHNK